MNDKIDLVEMAKMILTPYRPKAQGEQIIGRCKVCSGEVYDGTNYGHDGYDYVCQDCFNLDYED